MGRGFLRFRGYSFGFGCKSVFVGMTDRQSILVVTFADFANHSKLARTKLASLLGCAIAHEVVAPRKIVATLPNDNILWYWLRQMTELKNIGLVTEIGVNT